MCGYQFTLAHLLFIKRVMFQQKSIIQPLEGRRSSGSPCMLAVSSQITHLAHVDKSCNSLLHCSPSSQLWLSLLHKLNWICGCLMFVSLFFACLPFGEIVWAGQSSKTKPGSKRAVKPKLKLKEAKKLRTMLHNCEFSVSVSF